MLAEGDEGKFKTDRFRTNRKKTVFIDLAAHKGANNVERDLLVAFLRKFADKFRIQRRYMRGKIEALVIGLAFEDGFAKRGMSRLPVCAKVLHLSGE